MGATGLYCYGISRIGISVGYSWFVEALQHKWKAPISIAVALLLLGLTAGCSDESKKSDRPGPLSPSEMLVGSWEFLEVSVDGVATPMPENGMFWYFIPPQVMCSLEKHSDGTYGPDLSGVYGVFDSGLIIKPHLGDQLNLQFEFTANSDTLQIWEHDFEGHDVGYLMVRVFDAPENEWCP